MKKLQHSHLYLIRGHCNSFVKQCVQLSRSKDRTWTNHCKSHHLDSGTFGFFLAPLLISTPTLLVTLAYLSEQVHILHEVKPPVPHMVNLTGVSSCLLLSAIHSIRIINVGDADYMILYLTLLSSQSLYYFLPRNFLDACITLIYVPVLSSYLWFFSLRYYIFP